MLKYLAYSSMFVLCACAGEATPSTKDTIAPSGGVAIDAAPAAEADVLKLVRLFSDDPSATLQISSERDGSVCGVAMVHGARRKVYIDMIDQEAFIEGGGEAFDAVIDAAC